VLVALPFEVLSELAVTLKAQCPHSVLVSCANGYQGYLPMAHEFKRGGYEVAPAAHFAPDTGDRILKTILKTLKSF
jgi:predicted dinucleotide-binding enzyme